MAKIDDLLTELIQEAYLEGYHVALYGFADPATFHNVRTRQEMLNRRAIKEKVLREIRHELAELSKESQQTKDKDELRSALTRILEWCEGGRGPEDHQRDPFQHIADCAKAALDTTPKEDKS